MMSYVLIAIVSMLGGIVQSAIGFGYGMISVIFYPSITGSVLQSSAITNVAAMTESFGLLIKNRKNVKISYILPSLIVYFIVMPIATRVAKGLPIKTMSLALGIVMIIFSIYYTFFNGSIKVKPSVPAASTTGVLGGIVGGFFALGGVPVGIYLLNAAETKALYYGTMQAYIVITDIYGTGVRIAQGIITMQTLKWIAAAIVGVLIGTLIGQMIYKKISQDKLKKLVYLMVGFSGIIKIVQFFA